MPQDGNPARRPFQKIVDVAGIQRIGFRFGFDDDALMREIRIVAPKPRKPFLALLDQPGFDGKALMPLPEGVETFLQLSIDPNALIDSIAQLGPEGVVKGKVDEFAESIRTSGKIDFRKDFLGRIGPRMVLFVAPDKSATVGRRLVRDQLAPGLQSQAGASPRRHSQHLPKLTLVAEVPEPKAFDRTLEGAINALNHQLAAQTAELAEKEEAGEGRAGGRRRAGRTRRRAGAARAGPAAERAASAAAPASDRPPSLAPKFDVLLDSTASATIGSSAGKLAYILRTPSDSPLKLGPPNFHPVIKLDGKYLVFSVDSESGQRGAQGRQAEGLEAVGGPPQGRRAPAAEDGGARCDRPARRACRRSWPACPGRSRRSSIR